MEKLQNLFIVLFMCLGTITFAQTGTVKGVLVDDKTEETIPFANVLIAETGSGFSTDFDGAFSEDLPVGTYTFSVSYIGYADKKITDVVVEEGKVLDLTIRIGSDTEMLEEVVVTAKQIRNTDIAVLSLKRKSINMIDGVSSQAIRKIGDSNAASAVKRITGVSVEGGKYVYVRGLGDRYTKTILNGMGIPGLDPDKNSLQMDIFPVNIVDNIIVSKSFKPDLPGDFSGGLVNIVTRDIPEEKNASISLGMSYNPNMHFNSNYLTGDSSPTDFLGFDNGLRALPVRQVTVIPAPINDARLTKVTKLFNNNMAVMRQSSLADYSLGFNFGNKFDRGFGSVGYHAAVNYSNSTDFYENVEFNNYIKATDPSDTNLQLDRNATGSLGSNNVLLSGMLGGGISFENHRFGLNALHIQNGNSKAGEFQRSTFIRNSNKLIIDNVEYTQSSISTLLLSGNHDLSKTFSVNWKLAPTYSKIDDKDVRVTPFLENDDGSLSFRPSEGAAPRRLFRNLDEINLSSKIDVEKATTIGKRAISFSGGFNNVYKQRDYQIQSYFINIKGQESLNIQGDPNALLLDQNVWTVEKGFGTYVTGNFEPTNTYDATQNVLAGYVMADMSLTDELQVTTGVRAENFKHFYTGENNTGSIVYNMEKIADNTKFLPAVNMIYKLNGKMNLRGSYAQTLARPSFKEASIAQIYDAITDRTFIGNINLQSTDIQNYDVRWEAYMTSGQMVSVSGFYKNLTNPIEIVAFSSSAPADVQPRNVAGATVRGVEMELRKNLGFITEKLNQLSFVSNVTLVEAQVELDKSAGGEFDSRVSTERIGEVTKDTREMQGQAPYIINSHLSYKGLENGFEANLSYNVQGRSLAVVGIGLNPDVYTAPFHNVSFKASKSFGADNKMRLSFGVKNILGSERNKYYDNFGSDQQLFESFAPFRSFSLGFNYKFI